MERRPDNPLIGRKIEREKACPACGSIVFTIEGPRGPHAHHLRCDGCGRGGRFMSRREADFLARAIAGGDA